MDAENWLRPVGAVELLQMHQGKLDRRKLRLFAVACCRRLEAFLIDARSNRAVDIAEAFANGVTTRDELDAAEGMADEAWNEAADDDTGKWNDATTDAADLACSYSAADAHVAAESTANIALEFQKQHGSLTDEAAAQSHLLRCIFGNPFRPVAFAPAWRSESAVALARVAYDTRNFTLLPILADALEEAGCDHADILAHCRDPKAAHARGCWVVDLVLNKK